VDDSSHAIGKRYARTDECGIPYAFTIDEDTIKDSSLTMREMDTMKQIRIPWEQAPEILAGLIQGRIKWAEMLEKWPVVGSESKQEEK
jgi:glycyl-tRNA synthetase